MEQYNMRANFYPIKEPVNGFIGNADLAISNIIRLRGIAVFENVDGSGYHIQFPGFQGNDGKNMSYIMPHSPEAFAQMLDVVEKAVAAEDHFGHVAGKRNPQLSVSGQAVNEPYADGRYQLQVGDLFTIHGITTQQVNYDKDGKDASFIAVQVPNLPPYEKDGDQVYPPIFKGLKSTYTVDGQQKQTDYAQLIQAMVISERKNLLEKKTALTDKIADASQKAGQAGPVQDAPAKETQR